MFCSPRKLSEYFRAQAGARPHHFGNLRQSPQRKMTALRMRCRAIRGVYLHQGDLRACVYQLPQPRGILLDLAFEWILTVNRGDHRLDDDWALLSERTDIFENC